MSTLAQEAQTGADVKSRFKPLTQEDLMQQADSGSLTKGRSYYRNGHIMEPLVRGATLQAQCIGSDEEPYQVALTLVPVEAKESDPIASYACNCPRGDFCKHLVALALNWIHKPEEFEVRPEFATLLQDKSREELFALLLRMLERHPQLETLLEIPLPTATPKPGSGNKRTIDPAPIRKQATAAFRRSNREWGAAGDIASDLTTLLNLGDNYAQAGQWANAQIIYTNVGEVALEHYEETEDEGEIAGVINSCAEGLVQCLDAQAALDPAERLDPEARAQLIRSLYAIWKDDLMNWGGLDMSADAPEAIARNVTDAERAEVEGWLRKEMRTGSAFSDSFHNRALVAFLVALKEHSGISDEELLNEYRRFGLYEDMASLLLERGRVDEAADVARDHLTASTSLLAFATELLALGGEQATRAFALVEARLQQAETDKREQEISSYLNWLGAQYAAHGMASAAFAVEMRQFELAPNERVYEKVKAAAQQSDPAGELWTELRPRLLADLERHRNQYALLNIYLAEGEVRSALDLLMREPERGIVHPGIGGSESYIRVAEAAEKEFPDEARDIYQRTAERLIDQRGRDNYQQAAQYLVRAKRLFEAQGRGAEWSGYIGILRERHRNLPALKEELKAAHL